MEQLKTSGYAPVNGLDMYYEIHGEDSIPLVLIHGGGSTIETTFGKTLPMFSRFSKVIAVELQAHGRTSDRDAPETFEQDADDVAALLKHLNVSKANFLGFSNGGTTTLQIAMRHPGIVNKLIVISALSKRAGMIPGFFDGMQHATLADMPEALKAGYLRVKPDESRLQVMFEKDVARMVNFKGIDDNDIAAIKAAVLFIVADRDVITVEHTAEMSRLIQGARLVVLPGTHGSFIGTEETGIKEGSKLPEITVALVEEFLQE